VFGQKDTCPVSDERPGGHHGFPVHCHAFNDLAAEKFSPVIIKKNFQSSFASVIWLPGYIMPEIHLSQTVPSDSGKPFSDIYIPDFSPFRAPPSHI
jgi:hypothetical protein